MIKAHLHRVVTIPRYQWGLPIDYFQFTLAVSLILGGVVIGKWIIGGSLALIYSSFLVFIFMWLVGLLKARKDPEFFGVWYLNKFKVGQSADVKRDYEP